MEIRENKYTVSIRKLFFCKTKLRVIVKKTSIPNEENDIFFFYKLRDPMKIAWQSGARKAPLRRHGPFAA